jgi:hypothetical protein
MITLRDYIGQGVLGQRDYFRSSVPLNGMQQQYYTLAELPKSDDNHIAVFPSDEDGKNKQERSVHVPIGQHLNDVLAEAHSSGRQESIPAA